MPDMEGYEPVITFIARPAKIETKLGAQVQRTGFQPRKRRASLRMDMTNLHGLKFLIRQKFRFCHGNS